LLAGRRPATILKNFVAAGIPEPSYKTMLARTVDILDNIKLACSVVRAMYSAGQKLDIHDVDMDWPADVYSQAIDLHSTQYPQDFLDRLPCIVNSPPANIATYWNAANKIKSKK
jgi:hypothetical protein